MKGINIDFILSVFDIFYYKMFSSYSLVGASSSNCNKFVSFVDFVWTGPRDPLSIFACLCEKVSTLFFRHGVNCEFGSDHRLGFSWFVSSWRRLAFILENSWFEAFFFETAKFDAICSLKPVPVIAVGAVRGRSTLPHKTGLCKNANLIFGSE